MATTIDWGQKIIYVQQSDMVQVQVSPIGIYEIDLNDFRKQLADLLDDPTGIVYDDTHIHTAPTTLSGVTFARVVEIINSYTVTCLPDTPWVMSVIGGNSNLTEVLNPNNVSIQTANSGGLVVVDTSGLTTQEAADLALILKFLRNRRQQDPSDGTVIVFDDDSITPLLTSTAYEDIAGTQTYQGNGSDRVDRLA